MHAYLFVGNNEEEKNNKMFKLAQEKGKVYEFPLQKIADMRSLSDFTKFSQDTPISIVIKEIGEATKEALNAFLKNLEEPGKNISYFLSARSEQSVIPTISSRCQIIRIGKNRQAKDPETYENPSSFTNLTFGQKIRSFEAIKKKEEAEKYLEKLVYNVHKELISGKNSTQSAKLIKLAQNAIYHLRLNANVNLQLTNFAVKSSK